MYAKVIVDTGSNSSVDFLTYQLPDHLVDIAEIGSAVFVPLQNRWVVGYILEFDSQANLSQTKSISSIVKTPAKLNEELLDLAKWISSRYICPLSEAVMAILPSIFQRKAECIVSLTDNQYSKFNQVEQEIVEYIKKNDNAVSLESLAKGRDKSDVIKVIKSLEKKDAVQRNWQISSPKVKEKKLVGVRLKENYVNILDSKFTTKQNELFNFLLSEKREISVIELQQRYGFSRSIISSLLKKGIIEEINIIVRRMPMFDKLCSEKINLTNAQSDAVDKITASIINGKYKGFLLHGVTASGKTEVYLNCIEQVLKQGKSALILLPEIAITTQCMNIFKSRFGEKVAVLHSALSEGERFDEWMRVQSGEARVVLGARSACLSPIKDLGIVIVDEEHDSGYKQDNSPRYHAKDVAIYRAKKADAVLILGSATPSVETYYLANNDEFTLIELPNRVMDRPMPNVYVEDMRKQYASGQISLFSDRLRKLIEEKLAKNEQIIILQNRRAYATFLLCRDCGYVIKCPYCDVTLKLHFALKKLKCHHCDYEETAPDVCPKCKSLKIKKFGIGTEKVAEEISKTFPHAKVIRMDRDTTSTKGAHASILREFREGRANVLVGTQMIAKGLDFPRVTLVGVISADTSLNFPDFRSCERTFQMISQVAGRSGRGDEPGEVVVQTFDPEHYAIKCAVDHNYKAFYDEDITQRKELNYPPFSSIVSIMSIDKSEDKAKLALENLTQEIQKVFNDKIVLKGPVPALVSKVKNQYRWRLFVLHKDLDLLIDGVKSALFKTNYERSMYVVDVNPSAMI
ncbi:MAG: primosomal protein N' [Armatimonadota bacterium]